MTSATMPENLMSLAPTVSSTRSRVRFGWGFLRARQQVAKLGELSRHRSGAGSAPPGIHGRAAD